MANIHKQTSNLKATPMNNTYLDIYYPPVELDFNNTTVVTLDQKYNKRPDLLAYDLYGDAKTWWIFTLYNRNSIVDPINDFVAGLSIIVPLQSSLGL